MGMARAAVRRWRRRTVRDACAMLVVLAIVAHFPLLALKMAATSLRLSSLEIFFTLSLSQSAVIS